MTGPRPARGAGRTAGLGLMATALVPPVGAALAHSSDRMIILTLPTGGFVWGAGLVVALTALIAGLSRRPPRFSARRIASWPRRAPLGLTSWISALALAGLILVGFLGPPSPLANLLPLWIWTVLWLAMTLAQAAFGNLWAAINPWTGPVRSLRRLAGRQGGIGLARLGQWPAVLGLFGFAWLEIVSRAPTDPPGLARIVAAYALFVGVLAWLEGEDWIAEGEFLTVFFANIARVAPLWSRPEGGRTVLMAGWPGAQILRMAPLPPPALAFVLLMLSSVSFDGLHETFVWLSLIGLNPLDFPGRSAVVGVNSLGLVLTWVLMSALVLGVIRLSLALAGRATAFGVLVGPLALSFLPIAAAYHLAHYLTALLAQGQYVIVALSDPLGRGDDWLGLGPHWVSMGFLAERGAVWWIWGAECALILGGHVLAVLLSQAIARRAGIGFSVATEAPLTLMMVFYTIFGLWLLSAPSIG